MNGSCPAEKLEAEETAEQCLVREIKEELNIDVEIDSLIDVWVYNILGKVDVLIITYLCKAISSASDLKISHEHKELGLFSLSEIDQLNMPQEYKSSIHKMVKAAAL